ncbi:FeoA family protein [Flavobacterium sp.]|uniref:FeoA family protein n=1 Tax=Flavobacterium sp. TaxID=239 RepID=UPI0026261495|nr:FeoA family protein [Flavobacterium sp.]MDD3003725.1 FeoA family protein [Flavobacterium sp.]
MQKSIAQLRIGEKGVITEFDCNLIPLKLIEMGCLPGNEVVLLQKAPLGDPLFLNINDSNLAIRLEMAKDIFIEISEE